MTLTKDIAAKFAVAAVAVAMIFSAYAAPAQAQTTEDLQQMINDLLAQVAGLQAQLGGGDVSAPAGAAGVCPYTWTRDLSQGSEGADVMKLQQFLNSYPDLRVSAAGAGSMGMETMYYGPATAAAVSKMQVMFRAEVLTPNGLVNPTGYFGASSRAKANDLCIADATTGGGEEEEGTEEEEEEDDSSDMTLSGEGVLATLELDDEEDEVMEGADDVVVAMLTLEAEDGDIELSRVTMTLQDAGGTTNDEVDPWDVFTEVSLWVDGDKVASFEADDEDEYLDEDFGEFRFSGLELFLEEDEEVEVLVAVSVMNSVDGAATPADTTADWDITPTSVRYFDADGVATTEDTGGTGFGDLGDSVEFDIVEEGFDDEADIDGSSDDPDAATLVVDNGSDESDEYVTHVFEIETGEDSSDLIVSDVWYAVTVNNNGQDITGGQEDVLNEITMTIDGVTVEGDAVTTGELNVGPDLEGDAIDAAAGGTTTVHYVFEFDEDVVLEADETYDVEVAMVFEGRNVSVGNPTGDFSNGVTIQGTAPGTIWEVEGLDNDNVLTGSDTSQLHTLSDADIEITNYNWTSPDAGTFLDFNFTIEANDEDFDLLLASFDYATSGTATAAAPVLTRTSGDATAIGGGFNVDNGDTATFRIRWSLSGTNGQTFDVTATSIAGQPIPDEDEVSPTVILNVAS